MSNDHYQRCNALSNKALEKQIRDLKIELRKAHCLSALFEAIEEDYYRMESVLERAAKIIVTDWPFQEKIAVQISIRDEIYSYGEFHKKTKWYRFPIYVGNEQVGRFIVFIGTDHIRKEPSLTKNDGHKGLIESIAEHLCRYIERRETESMMVTYRDELEHQLLLTNDELKREIANRFQVESALKESENRYRSVIEASPDPIVVYNSDGNMTFINPAFTRIFGWSPEECIGQSISFIPSGYSIADEIIYRKISNYEPFTGIETQRLTKNGNRVDVSISCAFFYDNEQKPSGHILTFQDITERNKTREEITFLAFNDPLTNLENRNAFYQRIEERIRLSHRSTSKEIWALLFLDLDRFKDINETLGHEAGDILLQTVAQRLKKCLRETDYIFRLGGDEFTVILTTITRELDAADVAVKIREIISQSCEIKGHTIFPTVSVGISIFPSDGTNVEDLVKNADIAMYVAKEENKGYRFFTEEMNEKAMERLKMTSSLRSALANNEFVIHYQPLVNSANVIVGMEALLRWQHPILGMIYPAKFIPLAEEIGAIVPIGQWVLYEACRQVKYWQAKGFKDLYVSVNLSTCQLREEGLVKMVETTLTDVGLKPNYLELEVTETGIMDNPEDAIKKMSVLRKQGVRFSIDDFGTGYSSLSYMKRFPIDTLKIDRSFIKESVTNQDDQEIIKTIISMARNLKVMTLAEGVETEAQKQFLCLQGCRMMQGYYFGKPMPSAQFEKQLILNKKMEKDKGRKKRSDHCS